MNEKSPLAAALTKRLKQQQQRCLSRNDALSVREIAAKLSTSRAAVYTWFAGDRLPKPDHLEALVQLLADDEVDAKLLRSEFSAALEAQSQRREDAPPYFLVSRDIAERVEKATDLWVLKWQKRFRSGSDAFLYGQIEKIISDGMVAGHPCFHYVFPSESVAAKVAELTKTGGIAREDLVGKRSYAALRDQIESAFPDRPIGDLVFGHELDDLGDVLLLGLPRAEMVGYFMIEYNSEGRELYGRQTDIFVEVDARPTIRDVAAQSLAGPQTYWFALPRELTESLRDDWKAVIRNAEAKKPANGKKAA